MEILEIYSKVAASHYSKLFITSDATSVGFETTAKRICICQKFYLMASSLLIFHSSWLQPRSARCTQLETEIPATNSHRVHLGNVGRITRSCIKGSIQFAFDEMLLWFLCFPVRRFINKKGKRIRKLKELFLSFAFFFCATKNFIDFVWYKFQFPFEFFLFSR